MKFVCFSFHVGLLF